MGKKPGRKRSRINAGVGVGERDGRERGDERETVRKVGSQRRESVEESGGSGEG